MTPTVRAVSPVALTTAGTSGMELRQLMTAVSDYYSDTAQDIHMIIK